MILDETVVAVNDSAGPGTRGEVGIRYVQLLKTHICFSLYIP